MALAVGAVVVAVQAIRVHLVQVMLAVTTRAAAAAATMAVAAVTTMAAVAAEVRFLPQPAHIAA